MENPQEPINHLNGGKKEVVKRFSSGLIFNMESKSVYMESAEITREQQGKNVVTEIRYTKKDFGKTLQKKELPPANVEIELPDHDPDDIIINGKPW